MSEQIRCAVVGYGGAFNMGKLHAESMNKAGMTTVAACDLDPKRMEQAAADFPGIKTFTNIDTMMDDPDIDLVVVILPHNLHAPIAVQAANKGKHVVVEKPMSISVEEADAMIEAANKNGVMISVFHNRRWDGDFVKIRALIEEGMIGDVFHIEACMGGMGKPGTWWRSDKAISGGSLFDWGAHIIDWCLHFIPEKMAGVDGYYHKLRWTENTNEDHTEMIIRFEGGQTAQVEISSIAAATKPRWRILGTKGAIVMDDWNTIKVTVDHEGHLAKFELPVPKSDWDAYYQNVADHLMKDAELVVKPEGAARIIAAIEAAEESSKLKLTVTPAHV
ncbi:Gfo/Idh/MocA family oxidoreductase [soil metagenome]